MAAFVLKAVYPYHLPGVHGKRGYANPRNFHYKVIILHLQDALVIPGNAFDDHMGGISRILHNGFAAIHHLRHNEMVSHIVCAAGPGEGEGVGHIQFDSVHHENRTAYIFIAGMNGVNGGRHCPSEPGFARECNGRYRGIVHVQLCIRMVQRVILPAKVPRGTAIEVNGTGCYSLSSAECGTAMHHNALAPFHGEVPQNFQSSLRHRYGIGIDVVGKNLGICSHFIQGESIINPPGIGVSLGTLVAHRQ